MGGDFDAMALKTVIKAALSKWCPLSIEMQSAIAHDQGAQRDIGAKVEFIDAEVVPEAPTAGGMGAAIKDATAVAGTASAPGQAPGVEKPPFDRAGAIGKIEDYCLAGKGLKDLYAEITKLEGTPKFDEKKDLKKQPDEVLGAALAYIVTHPSQPIGKHE